MSTLLRQGSNEEDPRGRQLEEQEDGDVPVHKWIECENGQLRDGKTAYQVTMDNDVVILDECKYIGRYRLNGEQKVSLVAPVKKVNDLFVASPSVPTPNAFDVMCIDEEDVQWMTPSEIAKSRLATFPTGVSGVCVGWKEGVGFGEARRNIDGSWAFKSYSVSNPVAEADKVLCRVDDE